jgi:hypothetical protein
MSELTLQNLLTFDVAPWAAAAFAWQGLAQGLDDAAEVFIRGTKQLPDAWPEGTDSEAAQYRASALSAELSNAYRPARQISAAVQQLADGMAQLRETAQTIVAEARAAGLDVDVATGAVSAPLDMYRS